MKKYGKGFIAKVDMNYELYYLSKPFYEGPEDVMDRFRAGELIFSEDIEGYFATNAILKGQEIYFGSREDLKPENMEKKLKVILEAIKHPMNKYQKVWNYSKSNRTGM